MSRIQDKLNNNNDQQQSQWQDLFLPKSLDYQGPALKLKKIATHLRQSFPDDQVEIQVQFETYSLLQHFQKKLQLEYQIYRPQQKIVEKNDWDNVWRQIHQGSHSKKVPGMDKMKMYKIMFPNPLECSVFYHHYEKKLKQLETEYNIIIIPHRKKLSVFLKDFNDSKISSFFVTEMIEMKNKLQMRVQTDPQIFKKARYSKSAVETLEKAHIKTMILSRYQSAVFYSNHYEFSNQIRVQVNKILAYHVSLIKFPDKFVNKYILKEIMRLIYFEIKPALKEIQTYYDMPVEVDIEKAVILITDFHEVFTDGVNLVKQSLEKLKILDIECEDLIEMKKIMQKAQYLPLIKFNYRYRRCFLLFSDTVTEKNSKSIRKFCQQLSTMFRGKYRISIHFAHLFQGKQKMVSQTKRVRAIAAEYHLNNVIYSTFSLFNYFNKIALEPVELSVYSEEVRIKQIEMFLVDFVTNRKVEIEEFNYDIYEEAEMDESLFHECPDKSVLLTLPRTMYTEDVQNTYPQSVRNQNIKSPMRQPSATTYDAAPVDKSQFLELNIPFVFPATEEFEENSPIKIGRRDLSLQILMQKEFKRKVRVWKVIIHFSVGLPSMKSYDKIEIVDSKMFELKNSYYRLMKYTKVTTRRVKEFKENETGFMSFVNQEKNMFVPIYKVQFISE